MQEKIRKSRWKLSFEERFLKKVNKTSTCWLWTAHTLYGYGRFRVGLTMKNAHRVAYELYIGKIPDGLVLDHLCRVTNCVNPSHLEPVTNQINILRGVGPAAKNILKTHCNRGHEFTKENTYMETKYNGRKGRQARRCIKCNNQDSKAYRERRDAIHS